jgi:hypothetical protein
VALAFYIMNMRSWNMVAFRSILGQHNKAAIYRIWSTEKTEDYKHMELGMNFNIVYIAYIRNKKENRQTFY